MDARNMNKRLGDMLDELQTDPAVQAYNAITTARGALWSLEPHDVTKTRSKVPQRKGEMKSPAALKEVLKKIAPALEYKKKPAAPKEDTRPMNNRFKKPKKQFMQPIPEAVVNNFEKQILRELGEGPRTTTELAEKIYGSEITTETTEWMKVYRVTSKLRKDGTINKRGSSRGVEWFLEGGDPPEEVS